MFFLLLGDSLDTRLGTNFFTPAGGLLGFLFGGYFVTIMSKIPYGGFVVGGIVGFLLARLISLFFILVFHIGSGYFHNGLAVLLVIPFGYFGHRFLTSRSDNKR